MDDYVLKLQEDLRKRLDRLCWMHNEPALHVADHFAELRAQVDYDAERLLSKVQSIESNSLEPPKDSDVNGTRLEFIRILEELEKRTGHHPKPQTPTSKVFSSLEQRVDAFKDSSDSLDDLDASYVQLAREITDEIDRVKRRLFGEQTIIYWQSREKDRLGSLVYFGDLFLNQLEIDCLMRSKEYRKDDFFQYEYWDFLLNLPYDLNKSKQVVQRLFVDNLGQVAKFCYIGKTEDEYTGYSAEGSSLERKFVSYQYGGDVSTFGTVGLDTSANLFDIHSSTSCRSLSIDDNPMESIEANAFAQLHNLTELFLNRCRLKSINSEMFNGLKSLKELYINNNQIERIEVVAADGRRIKVAKANLSHEEKEMVKKHLFTDLSSSLWLFSLSGNKLQKLDLNCLSNLKWLYTLDLSNSDENYRFQHPRK